MNSRFQKLFIGSVGLCVISACAITTFGEPKAKYAIKDVMKEIHKGEDNIGKRVSSGKASAGDIAKMVEYYEALPSSEPPRGDKAAWAAKTSKLLAAAKAVKTGSPDALQLYKEAANCKACHSEHKPEDKK